MSGLDQKSLLRTLTISKGAILAPHIDAYLAAGKFPEKWEITIPNYKEKDLFFHPSGDCFTTPLSLWRQRRDLETHPKPSAALRKTFDCGHMWHGYLEAIVQELGFVDPENVEQTLETQFQDPHPFTVRGTIDLRGVRIPGHGEWLVDIKTMNKPEFEAGANEFTFKKWEAQVNCYMDWVGTENAIILAISKDSPHDMREYKIEQKPELINEIYSRWSYTQECLDKNMIPEDNYQPAKELLNPGDSSLDVIIAETSKTLS